MSLCNSTQLTANAVLGRHTTDVGWPLSETGCERAGTVLASLADSTPVLREAFAAHD
jgi:hypothetical protein